MGLLNKILGKGANDTVRVEIKPFLDEYKGYMTWDLFFDMLEKEFNEQYYSIPQGEYDKILAEKAKMDKFNESLFKATDLNNEGIALEKEGKIDEAIAVYEQNIGKDVYQTHHPYYRLAVLYRKRKDYDNEIRVIEIAIKYLCNGNADIDGYGQRKAKALELKRKSLSLNSNENTI